MVKPLKKSLKKQLQKLKEQDKKLEELPSIKSEEKKFEKGESFLKRFFTFKKVRMNKTEQAGLKRVTKNIKFQ
jgi:hypothetical protein